MRGRKRNGMGRRWGAGILVAVVAGSVGFQPVPGSAAEAGPGPVQGSVPSARAVGDPTPGTCTSQPPGRDPAATLLIAKRRQYWFVRGSFSSGPADVCFVFGNPGDIGVMGDWDADGQQTPAVFRPQTGTWYVSNDIFARRVDGVFTYGSPGDVPTKGDWDGNGSDSIAVFRKGQWFVTNNNASGTAQQVFTFGNPTDTPLGGPAGHPQVYRRSNAIFHEGVRNDSDGSWWVSDLGFGNPWDKGVFFIPASARFSGKAVVFRPSNATWYELFGATDARFGDSTDQPLWSPAFNPQ